jgi:hypothetical protein
MPFDMNKLSHDARADIMRARLAPTMAEAARLYFAAMDRHSIPKN